MPDTGIFLDFNVSIGPEFRPLTLKRYAPVHWRRQPILTTHPLLTIAYRHDRPSHGNLSRVCFFEFPFLFLVLVVERDAGNERPVDPAFRQPKQVRKYELSAVKFQLKENGPFNALHGTPEGP